MSDTASTHITRENPNIVNRSLTFEYTTPTTPDRLPIASEDIIVLKVGKLSGLVRVKVHINDEPFEVVMDSGSGTSLISVHLVNRLLIDSLPKPVLLSGIGTEPVSALGTVTIPIDFGSESITHTFLCLKDFKFNVLLGNDFLTRYGVIINYKDHTVEFKDNKLSMLAMRVKKTNTVL